MGKWTLGNYSTRCPTYHQQLRETNFWKTVRVVEVRALVITMHYSIGQAQLKIPCDTLRDVETEASADALPDTVADLKREKVAETVAHVKIASKV